MEKWRSRLPEWTGAAGGRKAWQRWLDRKVGICVLRAVGWAVKRGRSVDDLPSRSEWREAILEAMKNCQGRGYYSGLQLSLAPPRKSTDWNWPSVDHLSDPGAAQVVLETRLVNDMKTIMSDEEFRTIVGHLAFVMAVPVVQLPENWSCRRSFAVEEQPDEPPLPA